MIIQCRNVPVSAVPVLAAQLAEYGAAITFDPSNTERVISGSIEHVSGSMRFLHMDNRLIVELVKDSGHFPRLLLIGGIKQLVREAVEMLQPQEG
jgi:hypothetical protein